MHKSESIKELALALSKAQGQFDHAKKDENNPFFKSKYATLASVIDAAKKPLADNGLCVSQIVDCIDDNMFLDTMLMHLSGEWIVGKYPIKPLKPDPQSIGSAITYARRYAFSAITGIAADDDDGNLSSGKTAGTIQNKKPEYQPEQLHDIDYFAMIDDAKSLNELADVWRKIPAPLKPDYIAIKNSKKEVIESSKS
jgi:hypothetical protein